MTRRIWPIGLIAAGLLLTGCAATKADSPTNAAASGHAMGGTSMAPGESMAGMSMPSSTSSPTATAADVPSATAKMVCGDDIRGKVAQVLALTSSPKTSARWTKPEYTCTYSLPMGRLVLSVQQSPSNAAAGKYFDALRPTLGKTEPLMGLGTRSYGTTGGDVVVVKDDKTLRVDATGLPTVFGTNKQKRTDFAYEIASDVLGCWTGNE